MSGDTIKERRTITLDNNTLKLLIEKAVDKGFEKHNNNCPIPFAAKAEVGHTFGMIKDVGGGDISKGVEVIRDNHDFTISVRDTVKTTMNRILVIIILSLVSGIGGMLYLGFKVWVKGTG